MPSKRSSQNFFRKTTTRHTCSIAKLLRWIFLVKMQGVKLMFGKRQPRRCCQLLLSVPRSRSTYVDQNVVNRERGCVDFRETIWIETCPNDHFWSQTLDKNACAALLLTEEFVKFRNGPTKSSNISRCKTASCE